MVSTLLSSLLTFVLPAFAAPLADGFRAVVGRLTQGAGAQPQNVAERIQLMQAEVAKMQALAALDTPSGTISRWVSNFRASFRYFAVSGILLSTIAGVFAGINVAALAVLLDLSGASMSFILGERMYLGLRK